MSELHDRLERLAARGTRRGAEDVLQGAVRDVQDASVDSPGADGPDLEILDGEAPYVSIEPHTHRRGRYGTLVAAFGSAALLGVGVLAVTAMFGSGGAGSPEAAVRQLADAVTHKDPLAAVDVLVPSEVRSMRESVQHLTDRAARLKIVDDAGAPLAGVDLSVDNLQLSTENLADGFAKVSVVSGELSAGTRQAAMSKLLQTAIRNSDGHDTKGKVDLARLAADSELPTFVIAVRQGGGWYVSPAYTALEYLREANDGPAAAFGSAKTAQLGADSPEAAVSDALRAWQAGDWDRLIALAPPDELPVYDYRAWLAQEAGESPPEFTIDKLSTTADVNGDKAVVKLDASGTIGSDDTPDKWQVGGTCPSTYGWIESNVYDSSSGEFTDEGEPETSLCLAGDLGGGLPVGLFYFGAGLAGNATGPVSIQVVREDGRWFVSPVSTALDLLDSTIDHLDERSIYPQIGLGYLLDADATIPLNQPFNIPSDNAPSHVLAFDGMKGQRVVGGTAENSSVYLSGQLYSADGTEVGYLSFSPDYSGGPTELPSTGSYKLVLGGYNIPSSAQLTLWDVKNAPKSLLTIPDEFSGEGEVCEQVPGGGVSCSSTGSACEFLPDGTESCTSTPTTFPAGPQVTPTTTRAAVTETTMAARCQSPNEGTSCISTGSGQELVTATTSP